MRLLWTPVTLALSLVSQCPPATRLAAQSDVESASLSTSAPAVQYLGPFPEARPLEPLLCAEVGLAVEEVRELQRLGAVWGKASVDAPKWRRLSTSDASTQVQRPPERRLTKSQQRNRRKRRQAAAGAASVLDPSGANLAAGAILRVYPQPLRFPAGEMAFADARRILFEDEDYVVVDKPAGLPSQTHASNAREWVGGCAERSMGRGDNSLFACHRLDLPTTGAMALAKSRGAQNRFRDVQIAGEVTKHYLVLTKEPVPLGRVEHFMLDGGAKDPNVPSFDETFGPGPQVLRRSTPPLTPDAEAKIWVDRFGPWRNCSLVVEESRRLDPGEISPILESGREAALYETLVRLETGRTHQIRAQFAALGMPVLNDGAYQAAAEAGLAVADEAESAEAFAAQRRSLRTDAAGAVGEVIGLHAGRLALPAAGQRVVVEAGLPWWRRQRSFADDLVDFGFDADEAEEVSAFLTEGDTPMPVPVPPTADPEALPSRDADPAFNAPLAAARRRLDQLRFLGDEVLGSREEAAKLATIQKGFWDQSFDAIYEDAQLLVLNKPFDTMLDFKAVEGRTHSNARYATEVSCGCFLKRRLLPEAPIRPCHQLDYATSGLLIFGLEKRAAAHVCLAFQDRKVAKGYVALVHGHVTWGDEKPVSEPRIIEGHISPNADPDDTFGMVWTPKDATGEVPEGAKAASTRARVLAHGTSTLPGDMAGQPVSLVSLQPKTGRRHQLRLNMAAAGHPIVGDATYGSSVDRQVFRMFLHAESLDLPVEPWKRRRSGLRRTSKILAHLEQHQAADPEPANASQSLALKLFAPSRFEDYFSVIDDWREGGEAESR